MSEKKILQHFKAKRQFIVETKGERGYVLNIAKKKNFPVSTRKLLKGGFRIFYV